MPVDSHSQARIRVDSSVHMWNDVRRKREGVTEGNGKNGEDDITSLGGCGTQPFPSCSSLVLQRLLLRASDWALGSIVLRDQCTPPVVLQAIGLQKMPDIFSYGNALCGSD